MRGKNVAILELDYRIVSFEPIIQSPWECDYADPSALSILLESESSQFSQYLMILPIFRWKSEIGYTSIVD